MCVVADVKFQENP